MADNSTWKRIWNGVKRLYDISPNESDPNESASIQQVCASFEWREAIYIEQGALRVRVSNIRGSAAHRAIYANVEEIPTPGLGFGRFARRQDRRSPIQWGIGAGFLSKFSDHDWDTGYGGWSLYFDPKAVQGVVDLASQFPTNLNSKERYNMIIRFLQCDRTWQDRSAAHTKRERSFPDC